MSFRSVNCGLNITRMRRHSVLENLQLFNVIKMWTYPQHLTAADYICHSCWELASFNIQHDTETPSTSQVGHLKVCISCGKSVLRIRHQQVLKSELSEEERQIANVFTNWIKPRQLTSSDFVCEPCYLRAQRTVRREGSTSAITVGEESVHPVSQDYVVTIHHSDDEQNVPIEVEQELVAMQPIQEPIPSNRQVNVIEQGEEPNYQEQALPHVDQLDKVRLPNIRRTADTCSHCLFNQCTNVERRNLPDNLRRRILKEYNFYVPRSARVCNFHLRNNLFYQLYNSENALSIFTRSHIKEMIFISLEDHTNINLENIYDIPDHLVHYWLGVTKNQYQQILNETPRLNSMHRGEYGLGAVLCKLRTADSDERIASLFQSPRRTFEGIMDNARDILAEDYVPLHLGFGHISREQMLLKNSILAEELFGNPEDPLSERNLIVIADGTYLYTQKSSNYSFQKDTYSLHKFHNLLKPFIFVTCDGYIIEVLGPYAATKNDASILADLEVHL